MLHCGPARFTSPPRLRSLALISAVATGLTGGCIGAISNFGGEPSTTGTGANGPGSTGTGGSGAGQGTGGSAGPSGSAGSGGSAATLADAAGGSWIRRLSNQELTNAIESLTGLRPAPLANLPRDQQDYGFDRVAESQTISAAHLDILAATADAIAEGLTPEKLGALVPACAVKAALPADGPALNVSRRPCIEKLIDEVGPRAFRRPVAPEKRAILLKLYDEAGAYRDGLRLVVNAIFTSADFLYVVETGKPVVGRPGLFALGDYEIATRLSLYLCETIPDRPLFDAAAAGQLIQPEQIAAQADRLLDAPCARRTVTRLYTQWLELDRLAGLTRDAQVFPEFNDRMRQAMGREGERLVQYITWDARGRLSDLFSATFTFVDADLAPLYGMKAAAGEAQRVDLPPQRRGILTEPAVLAITSPPNATSPVERGVYVVKRLLCGELPDPPQDVEIKPPKQDRATTTREKWERHAVDPFCAGCHRLIDPVGFALEDFDALGRYRTMENGRPINPTGGVPSIGVADGKITGGAQLAVTVASSSQLGGCFARQVFRFGLARLDREADAKALAELGGVIERGGSLKQTLVALTRTFAFRHRAVAP